MKTIINLFEESVSKYPNNPYIWEKLTDKFEPTTYTQTHTEVVKLAAGLLSLGIKKDDKVALLSEGRKYWILSELAILYTGAVNVPLSIKLEGNDLIFRLEHSETNTIIVSGNQAPKIEKIREKLPLVKRVIYLDPQTNYKPGDLLIDDIFRLGEEFLKINPKIIEETSKDVKPSDYANISYTSGTTADPKGIILSHRNYTANVEQALTLMDIPEHYRTLLILPLDHCFAHVAGIYSFMAMGASIATVQVGKNPMDTLKNIPINIKEIQPSILLSVPALAKNFKKNIEAGIKAKGAFTEKLFNHAINISYAYNKEGWNKGSNFTFIYKPLIWLYDKILFSKIRQVFGGKMDFFIGGGALLDIELQRFYYAIGIPMFQGYGLSEATPIISSNSLRKHKLGSSGYLVKYLDIKICDDNDNELPIGEKGEIVVRGENVMVGYWKNEKATLETIKNGWLHTGDMGYMDKDGFLYVLGRFKSLLIASDGEKYSPEGIEESLVQHSKYIENVVLYNNQNPYTTALVVPSKEAIKRAINEKGLSMDSHEAAKEAINIINQEISKFKPGGEFGDMFPDRWLPSTFAILNEGFNEQNGMINSTLKVVRGKVETKYKDRLELLYTPEGKNIHNETNIESVLQLLEV
ncbi:MAG TPA: AMP-binding protein [Tenuifilaceae bacterium]|nr:AMP-binding protein [Tenuifilaceae bacterium]HPN22110.1 AMP-binding protein [Tenuifilaceae bacterium]